MQEKPEKLPLTVGRVIKGAIVSAVMFGVLGTVSAIWENQFFIRMTPAGNAEIWILLVLSALIGVFVAVRRPGCSAKTAGAGGVLGFLGVACPVCKQILLLVFGGDLLLTYFEPIRIYVAVLGVGLAGWAVFLEIRRKDVACQELPESSITPT
jgi:hypothetical protein